MQVQLVTVNAGGAKAQVMVKGGAEGDRFSKDTFESAYWDKPKGKNYRTPGRDRSGGGVPRPPARWYVDPALAARRRRWPAS